MVSHGLERCLRALPAPDAVTFNNLCMPPTCQQELARILTVISCPAHALFNRCAYTVNVNQRTGWAVLRDPKTLAATVAGIQALPDGLSPRQAAIAASFLASLLARIAKAAREQQRLADDGATAASCLPGVPDPVPLLAKLAQHGVACSDAGGTVAPQEIDGLDFSKARELAVLAKCCNWEELPGWRASPRYLTLEVLASLAETAQKDSCELTEKVVERVAVEAAASQQELAGWLLRAVVEAPQESLLLCNIMDIKWPAQVLEVLCQLLLQSHDAEAMLMDLPGKWLNQLQTCNLRQLPFVMEYFSSAVMLYTTAVEACLQDPSKPIPAPRFIVSITSLLLQFMEGPAFLLPQPQLQPQPQPSFKAESAAAPASQLVAQEQALHREDQPLKQLQFQPEQQQQHQKQQQQQQQQQLTSRNTKTAALAKAECIKEVLLQDNYLHLPSTLALVSCSDTSVLKEAVQSGLAARMFVAALRGVGGEDVSAAMCGVLVDMAAEAKEAQSSPHSHLSGVEAACKDLGEQLMAKLESDPALVDALLSPGWNQEPRVFIVRTLMATLPRGAESEAARRILLELASNLVIGIRVNQRGMNSKLAVVEGLLRCEAAPRLLWECGPAAVQAILGQIQKELVLARPMLLLEPVMAELLALPDPRSLRVLSGDVLTKPTAMAWQKELLWRIGQGIGRAAQDASLRASMWDYVAFQAEHKMTGQQLEVLYTTMQRQGYSGQDKELLIHDTMHEARVRSPCVKRATAGICAFLCAFLAHAATADPSTLPPSYTQQLAVFITSATKDAAWLAQNWGRLDGPAEALCAVVACLATSAAMLGGRWPVVSAMMHPADMEHFGGAGRLMVWLLAGDLMRWRRQPVSAMAAVAWLATLMRAQPLKAVRALLQEAVVWRTISLLYESGEDGAPTVVQGLMRGVAAAVEEAGLLRLAREAPKTAQLEGELQIARERSGGGDVADVLAVSEFLASRGLKKKKKGGHRVGAEAAAAGAVRVQASVEVGVEGVDWKVRLPGEWGGVDEVLQREWWGAVQGWVREREAGVATSHNAEDEGPGGGVGGPEPAAVAAREGGSSGRMGLGGVAGAAGVLDKLKMRSCIVCGAEAGVRNCSGCHVMGYCSTGCQKAGWKGHRQVCKALQAWRAGMAARAVLDAA